MPEKDLIKIYLFVNKGVKTNEVEYLSSSDIRKMVERDRCYFDEILKLAVSSSK